MSDVDWTPVMVEKKILEISNRIAKGVLICDERYRAYLDAKRAFDIAHAKAYFNAVGTIPEKEALVDIATEDERAAKDVADAAYKVVKEQREALNAELDAYRSIGASIRQAYAVAGVGER